jgi:predicted RNA-binding protein with TRAM domain
VRAVFLVLLSANLLFLAWARWIDGPRDVAAQDSLSRLPRLQLVTESPPGSKPTSAILNVGTALRANFATAERTSFQAAEFAQTCTSVGPFNDIASAARAAGLLTQRGFHLQQRAEEGDTIEGYWVFVGDMQSDEDVARVVGRLEKSGFADAHVMKNYSTNRRVSVGMFSTRERAEKRAGAVRNMGLQPEIGERKFPGTVYWVDVALKRGPGSKQLPPEYSFTDIGHAKVAMQPCPAGLRPVDPGDTPTRVSGDDAGGVTWGLPRTTVASAPKVR